MSRTLITAADVQAALTSGHLSVPAGAIVTALARDTAADLGVELVSAEPPTDTAVSPLRTPSSLASNDLTQQVRSIVTALLAGGTPSVSEATSAAAPVKLCRGAEAVTEPFPYPGPPPGQQVRTGDVITSADGAPMAAGYMTLTAGEFPWTFSYDEIQVVLEGELHLATVDGVRVGKPGDVLYVPKGSRITFGTPSWARFVYVTFPADWEQGL